MSLLEETLSPVSAFFGPLCPVTFSNCLAWHVCACSSSTCNAISENELLFCFLLCFMLYGHLRIAGMSIFGI